MKSSRRQYDAEFKKMAVELSQAKGSLKETAEELGITPQILGVVPFGRTLYLGEFVRNSLIKLVFKVNR